MAAVRASEIRLIRDRLGLSQESFARVLDVSARSAARWEATGTAPVKADTSRRLAKATEILTLAQEVYGADIASFMSTPRRGLDLRTPLEAMLHSDLERVRQLARPWARRRLGVGGGARRLRHSPRPRAAAPLAQVVEPLGRSATQPLLRFERGSGPRCLIEAPRHGRPDRYAPRPSRAISLRMSARTMPALGGPSAGRGFRRCPSAAARGAPSPPGRGRRTARSPSPSACACPACGAGHGVTLRRQRTATEHRPGRRRP